MGRLTLILGGARSGKSSLAERMAQELGGREVLFVATAQAFDEEMRERIQNHQRDRSGKGWRTLEAPTRTGAVIEPAVGTAKVVLVDCLTLLVSNRLCALPEGAGVAAAEAAATEETQGLVEACRSSSATFIVVSNEVGFGLVPPYPLGRSYRDALGRANQLLAAAADDVYFLVAGLPMKLK